MYMHRSAEWNQRALDIRMKQATGKLWWEQRRSFFHSTFLTTCTVAAASSVKATASSSPFSLPCDFLVTGSLWQCRLPEFNCKSNSLAGKQLPGNHHCSATSGYLRQSPARKWTATCRSNSVDAFLCNVSFARSVSHMLNHADKLSRFDAAARQLL